MSVVLRTPLRNNFTRNILKILIKVKILDYTALERTFFLTLFKRTYSILQCLRGPVLCLRGPPHVKNFNNEVHVHSRRGIQLIERDEEVCIFYEKVNIQEQMTRNGDVELQAREEEIRFLKMQLNEENRSLTLLRKSLPNKRALEQELVTIQIQVSRGNKKY